MSKVVNIKTLSKEVKRETISKITLRPTATEEGNKVFSIVKETKPHFKSKGEVKNMVVSYHVYDLSKEVGSPPESISGTPEAAWRSITYLGKINKPTTGLSNVDSQGRK